MIKLKNIIKEIQSSKEIPLGDGYILKRFGNVFKVYFGDENEPALSLYVVLNDNRGQKLKIPWVAEVDIVDKHREKGLYRRTLPILKDIFGFIRSDNRGPISDGAERAWKSVGAKSAQACMTNLPVGSVNIYGGSWFILESYKKQIMPKIVSELLKKRKEVIQWGESEHAKNIKPDDNSGWLGTFNQAVLDPQAGSKQKEYMNRQPSIKAWKDKTNEINRYVDKQVVEIDAQLRPYVPPFYRNYPNTYERVLLKKYQLI